MHCCEAINMAAAAQPLPSSADNYPYEIAINYAGDIAYLPTPVAEIDDGIKENDLIHFYRTNHGATDPPFDPIGIVQSNRPVNPDGTRGGPGGVNPDGPGGDSGYDDGDPSTPAEPSPLPATPFPDPSVGEKRPNDSSASAQGPDLKKVALGIVAGLATGQVLGIGGAVAYDVYQDGVNASNGYTQVPSSDDSIFKITENSSVDDLSDYQPYQRKWDYLDSENNSEEKGYEPDNAQESPANELSADEIERIKQENGWTDEQLDKEWQEMTEEEKGDLQNKADEMLDQTTKEAASSEEAVNSAASEAASEGGSSGLTGVESGVSGASEAAGGAAEAAGGAAEAGSGALEVSTGVAEGVEAGTEGVAAFGETALEILEVVGMFLL